MSVQYIMTLLPKPYASFLPAHVTKSTVWKGVQSTTGGALPRPVSRIMIAPYDKYGAQVITKGEGGQGRKNPTPPGQ
jgi:hypothetical protein